MGLPWWLSSEGIHLQCRRCRRCGFNPWVWKIEPFCNLMDCSLQVPLSMGFPWGRILERVAISSSRGFSWPRDWTWVSYLGRWILYHWVTRRRKWQPIPVFLPGKSHGWKSLVGYSPWGCKGSDMTEWLHFPKSEIPQSVPTFHLSNFIIFLFDVGTYIKHVLCIRVTWDTC